MPHARYAVVLVFLLLVLLVGSKTLVAGDHVSDRPAVYNLKRWVVEEHADPVKRALEVYKKKSQPRHTRRVWLTDRTDGKKRLVVEYAAHGSGGNILFSPDEYFMYYPGIALSGQNVIYGVNLLSNQRFSLGPGEDVSTVNCPDKKSYVVVQSNEQGAAYQVYTVAGKRMESFTDLKSPGDIEQNLCR